MPRNKRVSSIAQRLADTERDLEIARNNLALLADVLFTALEARIREVAREEAEEVADNLTVERR